MLALLFCFPLHFALICICPSPSLKVRSLRAGQFSCPFVSVSMSNTTCRSPRLLAYICHPRTVYNNKIVIAIVYWALAVCQVLLFHSLFHLSLGQHYEECTFHLIWYFRELRLKERVPGPRLQSCYLSAPRVITGSLTPEPTLPSVTLHYPPCFQRDGYDYICSTCVKGWPEHNKMKSALKKEEIRSSKEKHCH